MPSTALQLAQRIARQVGWPQPTTIAAASRTLTDDKIVDHMNEVGVALGHYYFWKFLFRQTILTTVAQITAGDADVTNASTSVTSDHADTVWTGTAGYKFKFNAYEEVYDIASVGGATSITLANAFNGTTATDGAYKIVQDEYDLPSDFDGELAFVHYLGPWNLKIQSPIGLFSDRFGPMARNLFGTTDALTTGNPRTATIVSRDDGTNDHLYKVILDPPPEKKMLIELAYYALLADHSADSDTWPFPAYIERVIVEGAAAAIRANAQDDNRGSLNLQLFFEERAETSGLIRTSDVTAQFQPDTGVLRKIAMRRRVSPGRYDLGWTITNERT